MIRHIITCTVAALVLALFGPTIAGCGSLYKSKPEQLKASVRTFNENVRWKRYHAASDFIPEERREAWARAMERAGAVFTVTDYDFAPVLVEGDEAIIQVDLTYHRVHGVVVLPMRRKQVWVYANNEWYLDADTEVEIGDEPPPDRLPDLIAPIEVAED